MTPISRPRVNPAQAAAICDVSLRTIYYWVADNRVEYVRTPTGAIRIFTDSLLKSPERLQATA
jgi:DNA-binding transcriptional MerR regulator